MKNKKGFTLVELLAVISVLGIVAIFLIPTLMQSFYNARTKLSSYELNGIEDAGKMYITDIDLGVTSYAVPEDVVIDGTNYPKGSLINGYTFRRYISNNGDIKVDMGTLVAGGYYDKDCKYAGTIVDGKALTEDLDCSMPKDCTLKVGLDLTKSDDGLYTVTQGYKASIFSGCKKK